MAHISNIMIINSHESVGDRERDMDITPIPDDTGTVTCSNISADQVQHFQDSLQRDTPTSSQRRHLVHFSIRLGVKFKQMLWFPVC